MSHYALHAHDLDPRRCTGIARYAAGLADGLNEVLASGDVVSLVVARGYGDGAADRIELQADRRLLYQRWLLTRRPTIESLLDVDIDLLHVTAPIVPIPSRHRIVLTLHDVLPLEHPDWYTPREARVFRHTMGWARRRVDQIVVPTAHVADQVCALVGIDAGRVSVTGEGVEQRPLSAAAPAHLSRHRLEAGNFALHLGSLNVRKNLTMLIHAWPSQGPQLVLAGPDGFGADAVHAAAATRPDRVRVLGPVPEEEIASLLDGALALAHPSRTEGFGLTVLEAMAAGTPVIVSADAGGLGEVVGGAGLTVSDPTEEAWRTALGVLADPATLEQLSKSGLEQSRRWTWLATAERTLAVYGRALR